MCLQLVCSNYWKRSGHSYEPLVLSAAYTIFICSSNKLYILHKVRKCFMSILHEYWVLELLSEVVKNTQFWTIQCSTPKHLIYYVQKVLTPDTFYNCIKDEPISENIFADNLLIQIIFKTPISASLEIYDKKTMAFVALLFALLPLEILPIDFNIFNGSSLCKIKMALPSQIWNFRPLHVFGATGQ